MVAFHLCYDLKYLTGVTLPWFAPPLQGVWRATISWTFLFIAGCMCCHSRSNLRRAARYLAVAGAIFVATSLVAVDVPISFGIIYCMGVCTLVAWIFGRCHALPTGHIAAATLFALFVILLPLPSGYVGVAPLRIALPSQLYATPWLSWLGFPGPGFVSGDYYPPLPFCLMYLAGVAEGRLWSSVGIPRWLTDLRCAPLEFMGRHALEVYVVHQPVLLLLTMAPALS